MEFEDALISGGVFGIVVLIIGAIYPELCGSGNCITSLKYYSLFFGFMIIIIAGFILSIFNREEATS